MIFSRNDLVVNLARAAGKNCQYNDALFDLLGDFSTATTLSGRLKDAQDLGLDPDIYPYFYSPFYAPLKSSAILKRGVGNPTFTRATTKRIFDHEGVLRTLKSGEIGFTGARRGENLITWSSDLTNAAWTKRGVVSVTGGAADPYGGATGQTVTVGLGGADDVFQINSGIPASAPLECGAWIKRISTTGTLVIHNPSGTGDYLVDMSLLSDSYEYITSNHAAVTVSAAFVATAGGAGGIMFYASAGTVSFLHGGSQQENVAGQATQYAAEYISTNVASSPAYHGSMVDGVKCFETTLAGAAIPDSTLLGYNSEAAATQLVTPTASIRDMTDASWVKVTMTAAKTATGIDGVANSASTITATGVNATILQTLVAAASSRTYSCYVKRRTGTGAVTLMQGTATLDITALINSSTYTLVQLNDNELNVAFGLKLATSGDEVDVDFNQLEAGAFATSPLAAAGAARNADSLLYTGAGNINASAGTIYVEAIVDWSTAPTGGSVLVNFEGVSTPLACLGAATEIRGDDGANAITKTGLPPMNTGIRKRIYSYGPSGMSLTGDGVAVSTGVFDGNQDGVTIAIGSLNGSSLYLAGNIKNIRLWQTQLSDAVLQGITT